MATIPSQRPASNVPTKIYEYMFTFGKHAGKSFKEVWDSDPTYISWANMKTEKINIPLDKAGKADAKWIEGVLFGGESVYNSLVNSASAPPQPPQAKPYPYTKTNHKNGAVSYTNNMRPQNYVPPTPVDPPAAKTSDPVTIADVDKYLGEIRPQNFDWIKF